MALSIDSPAAKAIGSPRIVDGVPVQRFMKRVIPVGRFVKNDKTTGEKLFELNVTAERQQNWVDSFNAMKAGGVAVKLMDETGNYTVDAPKALLTKNHAGAFEKGAGKILRRQQKMAENVIGETLDMFIEGDWVNAIVEVKGAEAIDLVRRNKDTSPEIDPCRIDGTEKKYGEVITAISLVPNPLIPGQTGFEPIAANDSPERYILSIENEEPNMKLAAILAAVTALAATTGLSTPVTEDNAADTLKGIQGKFAENQTALTKALSDDEPTLSATESYFMAELGNKEIDRLLDAGVVSAKGATDLKAAIVGTEKNLAPFILSEDEPINAIKSLKKIIDTILGNPGVKKGVKTVIQDTRALSEDAPEAPKPMTAERTEELLSMSSSGREILRINGSKK